MPICITQPTFCLLHSGCVLLDSSLLLLLPDVLLQLVNVVSLLQLLSCRLFTLHIKQLPQLGYLPFLLMQKLALQTQLLSGICKLL